MWLVADYLPELAELDRRSFTHPETSGFARMAPDVVARVERAVRDDLASGRWDARHGQLRQLDAYDAGTPGSRARLRPGPSRPGPRCDRGRQKSTRAVTSIASWRLTAQ